MSSKTKSPCHKACVTLFSILRDNMRKFSFITIQFEKTYKSIIEYMSIFEVQVHFVEQVHVELSDKRSQ